MSVRRPLFWCVFGIAANVLVVIGMGLYLVFYPIAWVDSHIFEASSSEDSVVWQPWGNVTTYTDQERDPRACERRGTVTRPFHLIQITERSSWGDLKDSRLIHSKAKIRWSKVILTIASPIVFGWVVFIFGWIALRMRHRGVNGGVKDCQGI